MIDEIFIDTIDLSAKEISSLKDDIAIVNEYIVTCSTPIIGKLKTYNRSIIKKIKVVGVGTFSCKITMAKTKLAAFRLSYTIVGPDADEFIILNSKYTDLADLINDLNYIMEVLEAAIETAE